MRVTRQTRNNIRGDTLISLVVACALVGFVELELVSLLTLNSAQGGFLSARMDTLNSVTYALTVMGQRVRSARNIGELYGVAPTPQARVVQPLPPGPQAHPEAVDPTQIPSSNITDGSVTLVANYFPSSGDPLYGLGGSRNVPSWPWGGSQASPYQVSSTCLVLQVPVFDINGYPLSLPPAYSGAPPLSALDTYIYKAVSDPNQPGQYMLQMAYFPGPSTPVNASCPNGLTNMPSGTVPGTVSTIITGIVGPLDNNPASPTYGQLSLFQYVEKFQNSASSTVTPLDLQNYSGVIVNLEIANTDGRGRTALLPVRSEMYMRNNVSATTIGSPPIN